jgi:hypothetical protein
VNPFNVAISQKLIVENFWTLRTFEVGHKHVFYFCVIVHFCFCKTFEAAFAALKSFCVFFRLVHFLKMIVAFWLAQKIEKAAADSAFYLDVCVAVQNVDFHQYFRRYESFLFSAAVNALELLIDQFMHFFNMFVAFFFREEKIWAVLFEIALDGLWFVVCFNVMPQQNHQFTAVNALNPFIYGIVDFLFVFLAQLLGQKSFVAFFVLAHK